MSRTRVQTKQPQPAIEIDQALSVMIGAPAGQKHWTDLVGRRLLVYNSAKNPNHVTFQGVLITDRSGDVEKRHLRVQDPSGSAVAISTITGPTKGHLDSPVCHIDWYDLIGKRFCVGGTTMVVVATPTANDNFRALPIEDFNRAQEDGVYLNDVRGDYAECSFQSFTLQQIQGIGLVCVPL